MLKLQIEQRNLAQVAKACRGLTQSLGRLSRELMRESTPLLEQDVRVRTPVGATQELQRGIDSEVTGTPLNMTGRVFSRDEPVKVATVERGRRPGAPQPPSGPGSALEGWVRAKIGSEDSARISFLIARSIGRRGTKGRFMFRDALRANEAQVRRLWRAGVAEMVRRFGK